MSLSPRATSHASVPMLKRKPGCTCGRRRERICYLCQRREWLLQRCLQASAAAAAFSCALSADAGLSQHRNQRPLSASAPGPPPPDFASLAGIFQHRCLPLHGAISVSLSVWRCSDGTQRHKQSKKCTGRASAVSTGINRDSFLEKRVAELQSGISSEQPVFERHQHWLTKDRPESSECCEIAAVCPPHCFSCSTMPCAPSKFYVRISPALNSLAGCLRILEKYPAIWAGQHNTTLPLAPIHISLQLSTLSHLRARQ